MGRKGCAKGLPRFVLMRRGAAARIAQVLPCTLPAVARPSLGLSTGGASLSLRKIASGDIVAGACLALPALATFYNSR